MKHRLAGTVVAQLRAGRAVAHVIAMQLDRSVRRPRHHFVHALAQVTGVSAWVFAALWGVHHIATRAMCIVGESKLDIAKITASKLAFEAYPQWLADHPGLHCPPRLAELAPYIGQRDTNDPWGNYYVLTCAPALGPAIVSSAGEDAIFGTSDDVRSDQLERENRAPW